MFPRVSALPLLLYLPLVSTTNSPASPTHSSCLNVSTWNAFPCSPLAPHPKTPFLPIHPSRMGITTLCVTRLWPSWGWSVLSKCPQYLVTRCLVTYKVFHRRLLIESSSKSFSSNMLLIWFFNFISGFDEVSLLITVRPRQTTDFYIWRQLRRNSTKAATILQRSTYK